MTNTNKVKMECSKCGGTGVLEEFIHIDNGLCHKCRGNGYIYVSQAQAKREQTIIDNMKSLDKFQAVILPASMNTYNDKDVIKSLGFRFNPNVGWIITKEFDTEEEAHAHARELGDMARAKGMRGVICTQEHNIDFIDTPQQMQRSLRATIESCEEKGKDFY